MAAKKRVMFGGKTIDFSKSDATLAKVFGKKPLSPPEMNKALWKYIKANAEALKYE